MMNQMPPLSQTNKILMATIVAFFLFRMLPLPFSFALYPDAFLSGHVYQIITYPFLEHSFFGLIFNALLFWFFGSELEFKWGTRFYVKYLSVNILGVGFLYLVFAQFIPMGALMGTQVLSYALLFAYALIWSERSLLFMFVFPLPAKIFCTLIAALELYWAVSGGNYAGAFHLLAFVVSFIYLKFMSAKAKGELNFIQKINRERQKAKFKVIKNDDDGPKYWQ